MKKIYSFLFVIYSSTLFSQTILSSYPIELKEPEENKKKINIDRLRTNEEIVFVASSDFQIPKEDHQIFNLENEKTHELFVFIKDLEKITILKYNRALFLKSEYVFPLQNLGDKSILGCSFGEDGNPTIYFSSNIIENVSPLVLISILKCNLENKTHTISDFKFPANEVAVTVFQMNNSFHILAKHRIMQGLIFYTFKDTKVAKKGFDFSSLTFQHKNGKILRFNNLIKNYPIEKIDVHDYNALDKAVKVSKLYIQKNHIVLTFDYNPKRTQAFDIDLENQELTEKNFPQTVLQDPKKMSNSFYQDGKLYQINASKSELLLDIKDFISDQTLKTIRVLSEDDKRSKDAPLFVQTDSRKPSEIRSAKRFLQHLQTLDIGLSVFKNKENTLVTFGGVPIIKKQGASFRNQTYIVNRYEEDNPFFNAEFSTIEHFKSVYFPRILDHNFEFVNQEPQPLGIDKLYYFLDMNKKITIKNILKYNDYYILGYYDVESKQYIMRKFTDGFN